MLCEVRADTSISFDFGVGNGFLAPFHRNCQMIANNMCNWSCVAFGMELAFR